MPVTIEHATNISPWYEPLGLVTVPYRHNQMKTADTENEETLGNGNDLYFYYCYSALFLYSIIGTFFSKTPL